MGLNALSGSLEKLETGPEKTGSIATREKQRFSLVLDLNDLDERFEEASYVLNFASGVVITAALCLAIVNTLTDIFQERRSYVRIPG